jgi:citrate lyase gamma subunit
MTTVQIIEMPASLTRQFGHKIPFSVVQVFIGMGMIGATVEKSSRDNQIWMP